MNYYCFHIGDYRRDTTHLSMLEHGAYRQLLDWYYLDEKPIPKETEVVFRRLSARTEEERKAIEIVLAEMFELTDEGYVQPRAMREVLRYHARAERARAAGKLGGRPKKTEVVSSGLSKETDAKANQQPTTNNQEPLTKEPNSKPIAASRGTRLADDWVLPRAWGEWAIKQRPDLTRKDILALADEFKDYWIAVPGVKGTKRDWFATWRNKIRNAQKRQIQSGYGERFNPLAYVNQNLRRPDEAVIEH